MLQRQKMVRVVTVALAGAVVVAGCGGEQPETVAPARATTISTAPLVPSEALAVGPSSANFSEEQVFDLLLNGLEPPAGASFEGRFRSPDAGNSDYGYPPEPCTPAQRLEVDEFGPYRSDSEGIRMDDGTAEGGVRLIWFDSAAEANTYVNAYQGACESYETVQRGGAPRGIERTLIIETGSQIADRVDQVSILASEWRATLNDRSWGNEILYAVQIENVVVEAGLISGASIDDLRVDAEALFVEVVDQVGPQIRP